jgi:SAM-dependent methyltransferase
MVACAAAPLRRLGRQEGGHADEGGPALRAWPGWRSPAAGHEVTGVDISEVQIHRARQLVPGGTFIHADATQLEFPPATFDAIVCLYALIHMPLADQPQLLQRFARWLRPSGWLLATTGQDAWTGTEDHWLDGLPQCGGATPRRTPTDPGSSRPASRSPRRRSSQKATADTPSSSGHTAQQPIPSVPTNPRVNRAIETEDPWVPAEEPSVQLNSGESSLDIRESRGEESGGQVRVGLEG